MRPREFLPRDFFDLPADGDDEAIVGRGQNILLRHRAAWRAARRLNQPVGERQPNDPDDVAHVETFVRATGDLDFRPDSAPTGLFSAALRDATRRFQRRSGLTVDGIVKPDGETFGALRREIGFDEEEAGFGTPGAATMDPDGATQLGLRCRQIAVRLGNLAFELESKEKLVDQDRRAMEHALERVRNARVVDAQMKTDIALGIASIGAKLASGNFLAAALEAGSLAARFVDSRTELGEASQALDGTAARLAISATDWEEKRSENAELEAERVRLGCSSISL